MSEITVCVPVFNGAAFVAHTLDSIAAQSFIDITVLVSLDRSDDDSETVCRRYLEDPRFELVVQRERLGWVRNVNALIERVETPFFCITPHDDLLAPHYLAELHALATSDAAIACAYSDIECFGALRGIISAPEIRGTRVERLTDFLLNHVDALAFRGLVRRGSSDDRPCLPTALPSDFAADTLWMLELAARGELRRVPKPLYAKRYDARSVHAGWKRWPREKLVSIWGRHTAACVLRALEHIDDPEDGEVLLAAAFTRALGMGKAAECYAAPGNAQEVAAAAATFCNALVGSRSCSLAAILARPSACHLRNIIARRASSESLRLIA